MMRSPHGYSAVLRRTDGSLLIRERALPDPRRGLGAVPLLRGVLTLVESLRLGSACLRFSADVYERDLEAAERAEAAAGTATPPPVEAPAGEPRGPAGGSASAPSTLAALSLPIVALATATGEPLPPPADEEPGASRKLFTLLTVVFALGLFVALPQAFAQGTSSVLGLALDVRDARFQLLTGVGKLTIVIGYMLAIRRLPEIRRVFQYHGAEHKAIAAYEAALPLTVESARSKSTLHPRCGTTFLVMVALVSILVFTGIGPLLPRLGAGALLENVTFFLMKLPFLPVIAAITFEIQRVFARYCTTGPLRLVLWPGFLVQRITTIEPDEPQLEVALAALGVALRRERAPEAPAAPADRGVASYQELTAAA
ncbi:MAG: DUF1385 domain-containing protein [Polyangiaceae bacterium]|nr:DUF1385 domain-containing protein [Polyangiaceae bacterium]